jgi:outer membrane protein insertion porin family
MIALLVGFNILLYGETPSQYEDKLINSIRIEVLNPKLVGSSYIKQNLQVQEGGIYKTSSINKSIRNLIETGVIKDVRVFVPDTGIGDSKSLDLVFRVTPKSRLHDIIFEGNDHLSNKKLIKEISSQVGEVCDESKAKADENSLVNLYLDKGFWNIQIKHRIIDVKGDLSKKILKFIIKEDDSRKIRRIIFEGNKNIPDEELLDEIETAPWRFWRFWSDRSKYNRQVIEEDLEKISQIYRNKGFLDFDFSNTNPLSSIVYKQGSNRLDLHIKMIEGSRSYFGKFNVFGHVIFNDEELMNNSLIKTGQPYSPSLLDQEKQRIQRLYGERGYLDCKIVVNRKLNLTNDQFDLNFEIIEKKKFEVNDIKVRGNHKTKTIVLLRELALAPGETFDLSRMETDEARLKNTKLFENVDISHERIQNSNDPEQTNDRRDMVIDVMEGTTGHLSFGVGFSSLEKAMMYAEFRQGNFDIMRWRNPNLLQGDGQKFRLRLKLGAQSSEARLAFEEPWFLNRRVAAGFELFREKSDYQSSYYDELRAGFEVYLRKRLFELVEGRLFYSLEDVLIEDISGTSTSWIRQDPAYNKTLNEIKRTISKVGLTLSRDTRDVLLFPTEGSLVSIRKEFAGGALGGDADYGRLEVQGARFFKTFEAMDQVLSVSGKMGVLGKFDGTKANVPFFEKFFLGGPYNLRGWDYRDAGPNDSGEPLGGNSFSYASLEYTFKLADPLRFALFYDGGFLRDNDFKLIPGKRDEGWHDNWGLGFRIMVMGMPLRLDLAFPITDPSASGSSTQFHFSGGTRF